MKFSFIIPVFNCGQYLDACIHNLVEISLQDYEVILVDDGSTDNSGTICDRIAENNKEIYCIHQKNQGVSGARNRGIQAASGDYICFLDADDGIEPEKLNKLLRAIENSERKIDIAVFGMSFDYYHKSKIYRCDLKRTPLEGVLTLEEWRQELEKLFLANSISPVWNKVFRRNFLIENFLYLRDDMFLYEDLEYSVRCMAHSDAILFEPEVIYHYRQSEDEGNAGRRLLRIAHIYSVVDQIEAALNELGQDADQRITKDKQHILISLYLMLAREKIVVSNVKQIRQICDDFAEWYERCGMEIPVESKKYVKLLLERKVLWLLLRREYTAIRHRIAVKVKNIRLYQKVRG